VQGRGIGTWGELCGGMQADVILYNVTESRSGKASSPVVGGLVWCTALHGI